MNNHNKKKSVCNAFSIEPDAITAQPKMVRGEFQNRSDDKKKVESMMQFRKGRKEKGELSDSKSTNSSKNIRSHRRTMKMRYNKKKRGEEKKILKNLERNRFLFPFYGGYVIHQTFNLYYYTMGERENLKMLRGGGEVKDMNGGMSEREMLFGGQ